MENATRHDHRRASFNTPQPQSLGSPSYWNMLPPVTFSLPFNDNIGTLDQRQQSRPAERKLAGSAPSRRPELPLLQTLRPNPGNRPRRTPESSASSCADSRRQTNSRSSDPRPTRCAPAPRARRTSAACRSDGCTSKSAPRPPGSTRRRAPYPQNRPAAQIQFHVPARRRRNARRPHRSITRQLHERRSVIRPRLQTVYAQLVPPTAKRAEPNSPPSAEHRLGLTAGLEIHKNPAPFRHRPPYPRAPIRVVHPSIAFVDVQLERKPQKRRAGNYSLK